jgi:cell division protein FtsQ
VNKKIKPNRYKTEPQENRSTVSSSIISIDFCLTCIITIAFISVLSLTSIFLYDFTTQSKFFNIKKIEVSGTKLVLEKEILTLANLNCDKNIFDVNLFTAQKLIASHPWIESAHIKRNISCGLTISVIEQIPLAIVKIKNLTDILINIQGRPFKEYNPQKDNIQNLPVITGVDLTRKVIHSLKATRKTPDYQYMFDGHLFDSIMEFLKTDDLDNVKIIKADIHTGISIETNDIYNKAILNNQKIIQIKLGFNNFKAKLNKAIKISEYIGQNFPERTITDMDFFNIEKVFINTKLNLIKGV